MSPELETLVKTHLCVGGGVDVKGRATKQIRSYLAVLNMRISTHKVSEQRNEHETEMRAHIQDLHAMVAGNH